MPTVLEPHHFPLYSVHGGVYSKAGPSPIATCGDSHMAADLVVRLNRDHASGGDAGPPKQVRDPASGRECSGCVEKIPRYRNVATKQWFHSPLEGEEPTLCRTPPASAPSNTLLP